MTPEQLKTLLAILENKSERVAEQHLEELREGFEMSAKYFSGYHDALTFIREQIGNITKAQ